MNIDVISPSVESLREVAQRTFERASRACGDEDELPIEIARLVRSLVRLQRELNKYEYYIVQPDLEWIEGIAELTTGCARLLGILDTALKRFNALPEKVKRGKQLWPRIRLRNGETHSLSDIRLRLSTFTYAFSLAARRSILSNGDRENLWAVGGLRAMRNKLDWIAAENLAKNHGAFAWPTEDHDRRTAWRLIRRGLVHEGYRDSTIQRYQELILAYMRRVDELSREFEELQDEIDFQTIAIDDEDFADRISLPSTISRSALLDEDDLTLGLQERLTLSPLLRTRSPSPRPRLVRTSRHRLDFARSIVEHNYYPRAFSTFDGDGLVEDDLLSESPRLPKHVRFATSSDHIYDDVNIGYRDRDRVARRIRRSTTIDPLWYEDESSYSRQIPIVIQPERSRSRGFSFFGGCRRKKRSSRVSARVVDAVEIVDRWRPV